MEFNVEEWNRNRDAGGGFAPDLAGADLSSANMRGADLFGVNLSGAYMQGADLFGADLRWADLRRADLRGAENIEVLDMVDPRGFFPIAVRGEEGWRILSGCRNFFVTPALIHWGGPGYWGDPETAARYIRAIKQLVDNSGAGQ